MPEFIVRLVFVAGLTVLTWVLATSGESWLASLPGGGWLAEFPVVLPLACVFVLLSATSLAHESCKSRSHAGTEAGNDNSVSRQAD